MAEMNFPRQLKPVRVDISEGDEMDRAYWANRLRAFLEHQPCVTQVQAASNGNARFMIYPDANND